ncbi:154aa long hypothetical protein [Pyrococcus horikoshii OT3]|uniref:Uncharacterized protein n=1 Tax=Pyrococcus horikoshii (strain ATCC 700860 / DSM 12428 / JCM 9974 / NBRC 100139 / OT-3) TaxID=70601 RepID=O58989_PYRHO|nr:154aa long hypothetical protein [Pyrococcus horikoshii OT3]
MRIVFHSFKNETRFTDSPSSINHYKLETLLFESLLECIKLCFPVNKWKHVIITIIIIQIIILNYLPLFLNSASSSLTAFTNSSREAFSWLIPIVILISVVANEMYTVFPLLCAKNCSTVSSPPSISSSAPAGISGLSSSIIGLGSIFFPPTYFP